MTAQHRQASGRYLDKLRQPIRPSALALAIAMALGGASLAVAQQSDGEGEETESARLDRVVVTARRQEETLQDAPVAVSAFSAQEIANQGINSIDDLARFAPGLSFSQPFGRSGDRPVMRGQSNVLAGVQFGVESGTAYFIDGIYYNGDIQSIDFNSLDRVEVIRGPQSALYGRNAYAGAINFITRDPTNDYQGNAKVLFARHDEREFSGSFSGPLVEDQLFFRIGARYFEYGGEHVNTLTGRKMGSEETKGLSAALLWTPNESFRARLNVMYKEDNDGPLPIFLHPATFNNCAPGFRSANFRRAFFPPIRGGGPIVSDNQFQYFCGAIKAFPELLQANTEALPDGTPDGTAFDGIFSEQYFAGLNLDWDLNGWTLSSQTGWRDEKRRFGSDSDFSDAFVVFIPAGAPVPPGTGPLFMNTTVSEISEWSQEFRIASPTDRRLRFLAGVFYYDYEFEQRALTFASPRSGNPFGNTDEITNQAIFGLVSYDFNDQLTLTAELRYQDEEKSRRDLNPQTGAELFFGKESYTATTPRLTLDYTIDDERMVYFTYARGAKPGGLNGSIGEPIGFPTYKQETSNNCEVGLKSTWLDGRLLFNAALYYIDAKDVQLTTALPSSDGSAITSVATNQGAAETWGVELEARALINRTLTVIGSYALADSEFTEGCDDFEYTLNTGGLLIAPGTESPECSIKGNQLPLGSKHMLSLGLDFRMPLNNGMEFFAFPTMSYESKKYIQVHNRAWVPATTLLNFRAGVRSDTGWELAVFGRNLLDDDSPALATRWFDLRHGFNAFGIPQDQLVAEGCDINSGQCADAGLPRAFFTSLRKGRTFGLELRYSF
ncbi:MAG: TonB-dependent receptor [Wenzhouxiangella sp.]|nr:TonB-dependent receptor [Wenzhouxiangella sp.]